ncbi:MAG: GNAT family N-acetyltransferase [Dongiaceae bacterium]
MITGRGTGDARAGENRAAFTIRPAGAGDLDTLAAIHEAAAREAYRHIFPADALFPREESRADLRHHLTAPATRAFVAAANNAIVGFIAAGPTLAGEGEGFGDALPGSLGQTYLLHVHPAYWSGGIGGALHDRAMAALAADGFASAIMWVLERNERARRFYEQRGWQQTGGRRIGRYSVGIAVIRYRRTLG